MPYASSCHLTKRSVTFEPNNGLVSARVKKLEAARCRVVRGHAVHKTVGAMAIHTHRAR